MNFFSLFKRLLIYKLKKKHLIDNEDNNSSSLDTLFHNYGSDKGNIFKATGKQGHGYSKFYTEKLDFYKNKNLNILEIGSYSGASAAALAKYFPNSNIFCFDINISNFKYKSEQIHVFGVDIKNKKKINKILDFIFQKYKIKNFDLIIDDGSHNLKDILLSLKFFLKLVKKDGLFVIEDFKHPNYYEYNKNINHIMVDVFLKNLQKKQISNSNIFSDVEQISLMQQIKKVEFFKGNLSDSDICFIKKY